MNIRVSLDKGAHMPEKAHEWDAGYDLRSRETRPVIIYAGESFAFDTGVHIEIPMGYVGMIKSKSGLNVNRGIVSEGVIDAGYTGSIVANLYNHSDEDYKVYPGDKITQLVIMPIAETELTLVEQIDGGDRGDGGFGSTGR